MSARGESLHTNQVTPHSGGYLCHMKQLGIVLFCLDGISRNEEFCIRTNWPTRPAVIFAVCSRKGPEVRDKVLEFNLSKVQRPLIKTKKT